VIANRSSHWVQFDEPELIVDAVKELVDRHEVRSVHGDAR
jgi:hypothetical protein